jgi:hypothetical protein
MACGFLSALQLSCQTISAAERVVQMAMAQGMDVHTVLTWHR